MNGKVMKNCKNILPVLLVVTLLVSCKKDHYNVSHVQGVNAEGEVLLPLASGSYTLQDLMQRFQIDSLIECGASGDMTYNYYYEHFGAVSGEDLLRFKDWNYVEHFTIDNPYQSGLPYPVDTVLSVTQPVTFEADHIHVLAATLKSGRLEFNLESNVSQLGEVVVTSSDIKDAEGNDLYYVYYPGSGENSLDLNGMKYATDEPNILNIKYEFHIEPGQLMVPEIEVDAYVAATDLAFSEMTGYVDSYATDSRIDTVFSLFPDNMSGSIEVEDALITLRERNSFSMSAQLAIDTAMVWGESIAPYSIFSPLPLIVDLPTQPGFAEVFRQPVSGWVDMHLGHALSSSVFTVNPAGLDDLITVYDTCRIDMRVDVAIPFSFNVNGLRYVDTVNMKLDEIEMPELVEKLTLEMEFQSTLPFELGGKLLLYDSKTERVTDLLLDEPSLIAASYDGQAMTSDVTIEITDERVQNAMQSNRIILCFDLDTDAHDVSLNAQQGLQFFSKAKVKYNGVIEYGND